MKVQYEIDGKGNIVDGNNDFLKSSYKRNMELRYFYIEVYIGGMLANQSLFKNVLFYNNNTFETRPTISIDIDISFEIDDESRVAKAIPEYLLYGGITKSHNGSGKIIRIWPLISDDLFMSNAKSFDILSLKREFIMVGENLIFKMIFDQTESNINYIKNWMNLLGS